MIAGNPSNKHNSNKNNIDRPTSPNSMGMPLSAWAPTTDATASPDKDAPLQHGIYI